MAQIVLNNGYTVKGSIDPALIPAVGVRQYMPVDTLASKLKTYLQSWQELAGEMGKDLESFEVNLLLTLDDIAEICEIPPEQWQYVDAETNLEILTPGE